MPTEPPQANLLSVPPGRVIAGQHLSEARDLFERHAVERQIPAHLRGLMPPELLADGAGAEQETIHDPERIAAIIEALIVSEARGSVLGSGRRRKPERVPALLTRDGRLMLDCSARGGRVPRAPFEVRLEGWNSVYHFRSSPSGTIEIPATILRVRKRRHRRVPAPRRLRVSFNHPSLAEVVIEAPAVDVSVDGVSFDSELSSGVLLPGMALSGVELSWKGGARIKANAVVAHVTRSLCGDRVGLRLVMDPERHDEWQRQIEGVLHPRTTRGSRDHDLFWQTYVNSGYFNLSHKSELDFRCERPAFVRSNELLMAAPEVGSSFVRASEKRVEAVAHQISPWPNSWLFYQFCRRPDARPVSVADDNVLMDLYAHAYEYVQQRPSAKWLVTYVQEVARFSRLVFHPLGERYAALGRASITKFRAIEVGAGYRPDGTEGFDVGPVSPADVRLLAAHIRSLRPRIYAEATGLGAPDLNVDATIEQWGTAGLTRKRTILVARRQGQAIASAVLDSADDGLHLFGLLDVARLYPLAEGGAEAFPALLNAAREWFEGLGKQRFAYFANDDEHPGAASESGCTDLGAAFTIVLPVDLLPELLEHVYTTTYRRPKPARARAGRVSAAPKNAPGTVVALRPPSKRPSGVPAKGES